MTLAFLPLPRFRAFDANGLPLAGGLLYSYQATSSTPQALLTSDGSTSAANPVVLDANGEADVRLGPNAYKLTLKTSAGVDLWTVDNISSLAPTVLGDYSATVAQMKLKTDPGELGTESLATALSGELERLRWGMLDTKQALDPRLTQWYQTPARLGFLNVAGYATGGTGTSGDPWTGWAAAIDWTVSNQDIVFPAGHYTATAPIIISGLRVHVHGAGKSATTIHYAPTTGSTNGVFSFDGGAAELFQCSLKTLTILSSDTTYQKVGVLLSDTSEFHMQDVQVGTDQAWTGGTYPNDSRGMVIQGRELGIIEQVTLAGDFPLQIKDNPNSTIDIDHFVFRDLYLITKTDTLRPCIGISPGVNLTNTTFTGAQPWIRGTHGLLWDDNTGAQASFSLKIENVRWEQSSNASGYMLYLSHNSSLQNVSLNNLYAPPLTNGIYLRNNRSVTLSNFYHSNPGGTVLNADTTTYPILLDNLFFQTGSALSVGSLKQVYDAGHYASTQIVRRIYDVTPHLESLIAPGSTAYSPGGILVRTATSQATVGTSEETLATLTLPAGTLNANGQVVRIVAVFSTAANSNSKVARLRWNGTGGTNISSITVTSSATAIVLTGYVQRTTSASAQNCFGSADSAGNVSSAVYGADTADTSADVVIYVRATTASGAGDVTFQAAWIEYLP